jgi:CheY-like chemotaxis protein
VQSGDYALVLMDCQMPGMDGYEATREIRRQLQGRKLPIVAFTAHALAEERDKVLQAGMDDYLTKPIELEQLAAVLSRQLGSAPRSASPAPAAYRARSQPPLLDAMAAELLQPGLRRPPKAVEAFLRQMPEELTLLRQAAAERRHDEVGRIAHKLKGSAGSLGALQLARLCEGLQHATKDPSAEGLGELVVALGHSYQQLSAALREQQQAASERGAP